MSRFHVGDKVVFDINAYVADTGWNGKGGWASDAPTTPMTITAIDGHTHRVAETTYVFHDKWLRPAKVEGKDAPEEESKTGYEVGDSVIILKDAIREFKKTLNLPGGEWIDMLPNGPVKIESMPRRNEIHVEGFPHIFLHPDWIRHADKLEVRVKPLGIERVLFNEPATIVFWTDGTKTVVKCRKGDKWDAEKGLAMACAKKLLGNDDGYHKALAKHYYNSEPTPDEMRRELQEYCHGRFCGEDCVINKHRQDPRCRCGMGYSFTTDKNSRAYISDADIRFFYKWLKDGLRDG